ncbi:NADH-quinone oxidoreductase subunit L [Paenibacillus sp. SC116]|uniref:NADH-quinone oxidoreductase subunit L n=1 Tax=Paenibacillus sp. SC116 TaxID=2968986 RepID=UPI00215B1A97|nr:NADH-quinone oxidoreductase subunit L [Paenibacillus sp. SC116]MCR8844764.1 NADH-quinone oxidoreductase subunit L [Paenibacillus sp. SC116]
MESVYAQYVWAVPIFPLLAFLLLTLARCAVKGIAACIGVGSSLIACVLSILILLERLTANTDVYTVNFDWLSFGAVHFQLGYELTNLNALMLVIVTVVSTLVNLYAKGYMADDERQSVFFAYIGLFTFSMLGLVISPNLLQLYIFWELVGVCSFLLIGFWYERPAARAAAKKAFIMTRIGDVGLLIAILILFWHMPNHALDFQTIAQVFASTETMSQYGISAGLATWIASLIFLGAIGKSGQFPLHTWLPDAMEGPTPISALIHAATMVAAGVYLVARAFDIFQVSQTALLIVASVGGFTAIFAATIAIAQRDIKRILAYSTVSQLGYMMLALGLGAVTAGIFHLFTHAFFKALLFLGAGSIIHAVHTQNIFHIGGRGRSMKITAWTFAIGALALSGVPPLSGFWSKDAILSIAWESNKLLFVVGVITAFLTAFYMSRLFFMAFTGASASSTLETTVGASGAADGVRSKPGSSSNVHKETESTIHESPAVMTIPLVVLAILAVVAGFVYTPFNSGFETWLTGEAASDHTNLIVIIISTFVALSGIGLGYVVYGPKGVREDRWSNVIKPLYHLIERKYYVDELYTLFFAYPLKGLGKVLYIFDRYIIDGLVRCTANFTVQFGKWFTRVQNGQLQSYGLLSLYGFSALLLLLLLLGKGVW